MRARDKLRAWWSRRENDLMTFWPLGSCTKSDAMYLAFTLAPVLEELDRRGYDRQTVRFSIEPKAGNIRFASQRGSGET